MPDDTQLTYPSGSFKGSNAALDHLASQIELGAKPAIQLKTVDPEEPFRSAREIIYHQKTVGYVVEDWGGTWYCLASDETTDDVRSLDARQPSPFLAAAIVLSHSAPDLLGESRNSVRRSGLHRLVAGCAFIVGVVLLSISLLVAFGTVALLMFPPEQPLVTEGLLTRLLHKGPTSIGILFGITAASGLLLASLGVLQLRGKSRIVLPSSISVLLRGLFMFIGVLVLAPGACVVGGAPIFLLGSDNREMFWVDPAGYIVTWTAGALLVVVGGSFIGIAKRIDSSDNPNPLGTRATR